MKHLNMAVALDKCHGFKPFLRPPRCKLPSFSQIDYAMLDSGPPNLNPSINNHHALEFASLQRSVSTPCLSISTRMEEENDSNSRIDIIGGRGAPKVHALVVEVAVAIASGVNPEPISSGLGGAYFIRARNGDIMAVAKPMDEEPLAFNNPKGFAGRMLGQPGLKRSIRIGETGHRELAAYLLDHGGFAGVPPSALVKMCNTKFHVNESVETLPTLPYKIASLQRFVEHDSDAGDLGPSGFSVSSIHRIGILDVRLLNLDRHAGNILVKKGETERYSAGAAELVPIDHGFCLPEALDDPYFEWLHWPQASVPFSESEIEYISSLDPFKDAELLRAKVPSLRESAIRVLVLCTTFLKEAVDFGMCLADIGEIMSREFHGGVENWSAFEILCMNAKEASCSSIRSIIDASNNSTSSSSYQQQHQIEKYEEEIEEIFRFEYAHDEDFSDKEVVVVVGKPPEIPRISSKKWMSKGSEVIFFPSDDEENNYYQNYDEKRNQEETKKAQPPCNNSTGDFDDNYNIGGVMMKSMSFAVPNHSNDNGCISFAELSNEEWESYLEVFKMLLPNFLDRRKAVCLSKQQRLGHSCDF